MTVTVSDVLAPISLQTVILFFLQVGLPPGEEFCSQWWSTVFDKAASNISVENSEVCTCSYCRTD